MTPSKRDLERAAVLGFLPMPDGRDDSVYCSACYVRKPLKLGELRAHRGSSWCAWRVASGDAAATALRLSLERQGG